MFEKAPQTTPLYLGPFIPMYNKILEAQRNGPRRLIQVPDVNSFLKSNFFIDMNDFEEQREDRSINQARIVPSVQNNTKNNTQTNSSSSSTSSNSNNNVKKESVFKPTTVEASLAMDLVEMSSQIATPVTPPTTKKTINKEKPKPKEKTPQRITNKSTPTKTLNKSSGDWVEKSLQKDRHALLEIKKKPVKDRFANVGPIPALSLDNERVPFLKEFVKNILREQKNPFLCDEDDKVDISSESSDVTSPVDTNVLPKIEA